MGAAAAGQAGVTRVPPVTTSSSAASLLSRRRWDERMAFLSAEDIEFPEGVAVGGERALGAEHPDVPSGAGDRDVVDAAVAGRGAVHGGPGGVVRRGLDLVRPPERGFPV